MELLSGTDTLHSRTTLADGMASDPAAELISPPTAGAWERAVLASMREPVLVTGPGGTIVAFNSAAAILFGDPSHLSGHAIHDRLPFLSSNATERGQTRVWSGRLDDAGGHTLDVEVSSTSLGEPLSHNLYVIHDISEHVEVNRLREQLLHSVAHELRTPMAVLENTLRLLESQYTNMTLQELEQLIRAARRTTRRLRSLMDDLLSAGNIQSGRFVVNQREQELHPIVKSAIGAVAVLLEERRQTVEHDVSEEGQLVMADRRYVRQALVNLLANASKYSPPGSIIRVATARAGRQLKISVIDQGRGIPEEQQAGLFERFYRVRAGDEEPGVGLGLAIVKGIAGAHGGRVGVDSRDGEGATVWFTLRRPRTPPRQQQN